MPGSSIDLPSIEWVPQPWRQHAACKGHPVELFFAKKGGPLGEAKEICMSCPVRLDCLQWAVDAGIPFGVFGGRSPRERRALRRGHADLGICGTLEGAGRHLDAGEPLCSACIGAERDRDRLVRAKKKARDKGKK
ncbi:MAG TPA: WhiB family transcriptional regulator [Acidimicrobiia bacterium]